MGADHLDNISITIILDPAASPKAGFGVAMFLAGTTSTLDGDRTRRYTDYAGVQVDTAAAFLSAAADEALRVAFSQVPTPSEIMVGCVKGVETVSAALALCIIDDPDFYGVAIESRLDADVLLISSDMEALAPGRIFVAQSNDADWLTTGLPAALTALDTRERTVVVFHDDDTEWSDLAWLAGRLAFDPDDLSAPWDAGVKEVGALSPLPTSAQKGFLDGNNANHGLPYGGTAYWMDPGVNQNTRPIYETVTADWFEARLQERIADLKAEYSTAGKKLVLDSGGQSAVLAEILAQMQSGESAGHFVEGQTSAVALTLTAADKTAQRMRFTGEAQIAVSGRVFSFTFNFGRDPVA